MRYRALCCDYDDTLATNGQIDAQTVGALECLIDSGRRAVLVTGRRVEDLQAVCKRLDLFACVVAENGAVLYQPQTQIETVLAEPPPQAFVAALRRQGVTPLSLGHVIVATLAPYETTVLQTISELGLPLEIIFNRGSVMVLPPGINKGTGLAVALEGLGVSLGDAVGIGDAENDQALLAICGRSAAVANALPALKRAADFVTAAARGAGVAELIEEILHDDLASRP